ncbi:Chloride channel protein CLC-e-like protein [Drosera capensis]
MRSLDGDKCRLRGMVTPSMDLLAADKMMTRYGLNELPVVTGHGPDNGGRPIGIIERECIRLACRGLFKNTSEHRNARRLEVPIPFP